LSVALSDRAPDGPTRGSRARKGEHVAYAVPSEDIRAALSDPQLARLREASVTPHRGAAISLLAVAGIGGRLLAGIELLAALTILDYTGFDELFFYLVPLTFLAATAASVIAWVMADADLPAMRAGKMDPAGRGQTRRAKLLVVIEAGVWGAAVLIAVVWWVVSLFHDAFG